MKITTAANNASVSNHYSMRAPSSTVERQAVGPRVRRYHDGYARGERFADYNDAVVALLGGHIQMNFGAPSTALGHVKAGRLRALGVTGAQRLAAAPDVPTFAETGLRGFRVDQWYGVFTAAGVPRALVLKLNEELARALGSPQFREQFMTQGVELTSSTPEEFAAFVAAELALWKRVLKEIGIQEAP